MSLSKKKLFIISILAVFINAILFGQAKTSKYFVDKIYFKQVASNKIQVNWEVPESDENFSILVFKSTIPFNSSLQIKKLTPVAKLPKNAVFFIDTINDYNEYYYAVLIQKEDNFIYDVILPSVNSTVKSAKLSIPEVKNNENKSVQKKYAEGSLRELPLPSLNIIQELNIKPTKLSDEVLNRAKNLTKGFENQKKEKLSPYYFEEDLVSAESGDEYFLFEILKNYFVKNDFENSIKELYNFLRVNRNEDCTNRAVFYLGESNYFVGNYKTALTMFLYTEDAFPQISKKWINSTLDFYEIPSD